MVDATTRSSLMRRTLEDAYNLLDDMTLNAFSWQSKRQLRKPAKVHIINSQAALAA